MPGFLLSVTTVRTHQQYGVEDFRTIEQREPTREDAMAPVFWPPIYAGRSAGPCGSVADAGKCSMWNFKLLLLQLQDYVHRWGRQPLGGRVRVQGAQHYSNSL